MNPGKPQLKGLSKAKMTENVNLSTSQADISGHMLVKVVPNTKASSSRHVWVYGGSFRACYACLQLQMNPGKPQLKGLSKAKMTENAISSSSQAD